MSCHACDLKRIYKIFEEKKAQEAAAKAMAEKSIATPVVEVKETKSKKKAKFEDAQITKLVENVDSDGGIIG